MQPTPLCGPKIVAILKADFVPTVVPIYRRGAADGQAVRPHHIGRTRYDKLLDS